MLLQYSNNGYQKLQYNTSSKGIEYKANTEVVLDAAWLAIIPGVFAGGVGLPGNCAGVGAFGFEFWYLGNSVGW